MPSIFPVLSLDRARSRWEEHIDVLTPVERVGDYYVKREDCFAPLGYGGINGSKVRQILWLLRSYLDELGPGARPGLLYAGSVHSPQLGRVAAVGRHFGLPVCLVIGTALKTAMRHENVMCAATFGAVFARAPVAYNPALQRKLQELHAQPAFADYYAMEYGLSVEGRPERIEAFYRFCGAQLANLPEDVETLLVPAGSCNTTIAILYAIARMRPRALRDVVLFGIGPTRIAWYEERLRLIEGVTGVEVANLFDRKYVHHPELGERFGATDAPYRLHHFDLHASKFAKYETRMPADLYGIELHPLYEGKIVAYLNRHREAFAPLLKPGRTLLWVVGSEPTWRAMEPHVVADLARS